MPPYTLVNMNIDHMYGYRKCENETLKRLSDDHLEEPSGRKRRKTSECTVNLPDPKSPMSCIIQAVENLSTNSDLIADCSRSACLPTVAGKHRDLKSISPETMSDVLKGQYKQRIHRLTIIDCRYPYEFDGGHIVGALNLYTKDSIQSFINETQVSADQPHLLIFHCEFSSERGPKMYRFLRSLDREMNKECYPRLNFPEIYLLEGGYKAFYETNKTFCVPQEYVPMLHQNHGKDLCHFRVKSKSWTAGEKPRPRTCFNVIGKKLF